MVQLFQLAALARVAFALWSFEMGNYAVIENGKVVNAVVSDANFASENGWVELTSGGMGWDYIDGEFVDNRPVAAVPVPVPAPTKEQLLAEVRVLMAKIEALA